MARSSLRTSRMLMGLLAVAVSAGLLGYYKNSKKTVATTDPAHAPVTLVKAPGTAKPEEGLPLMVALSPKPTTAPAPEPAALVPANTQVAIATEPTTKPASTPRGEDMVQMLDRVNGFNPQRPAAPAATGDTFADAKARLDADDLLGARKILNDALLSGKLSPAQAEQAKQQLSSINDIVVLSPRKFVNDTFAESYVVKGGDRMAKIAAKHDITPDLLLRMNGMSDARKLQASQTLKVINGPFNAVVTKSAFTLDLYLGNPGEPGSMFVKQYRVALGRDDSTPLGTWMVEAGKKQKNPKFWGSGPDHPPMEADDPQNPLGEYWIGLVGTDGHAVDKHGYGIHGTIDPDSIGKMASLGCIRLKNEDVAVVFELLTEGKSFVLVKP